MWSSRSISSLQRTYDESYLKCSTAVYYESQGDESEAMTCWKSALDQIRQCPIHKKQSSYAPKSETERALVDSIRELEVQCKERIDLLEALRISREEDSSTLATPSATGAETTVKGPLATASSSSSGHKLAEKGWIGEGTIPAITYTELSKPPLTKRPSLPPKSSSEQPATGGYSRADQSLPPNSTRPPALPPYGPSTTKNPAADRSPSPDRHSMRTTLRSGKSDKSTRTLRSSPVSKITKGPGASKAATLAWTSIISRQPPPARTSSTDVSNASPKLPEVRRSTDYSRTNSASEPTTTSTHWDSHRRRLVPRDSSTATASRTRADPEPPSRTSGDYASSSGPSTLALGAASSAINSLSLQDRQDPTLRSGPRHSSSSLRASLTKLTDGVSATPSQAATPTESSIRRKPVDHHRIQQQQQQQPEPNSGRRRVARGRSNSELKSDSTLTTDEDLEEPSPSQQRRRKGKQKEIPLGAVSTNTPPPQPQSPLPSPAAANDPLGDGEKGREKGRDGGASSWEQKKKAILRSLPPGVDEAAARAIFNEIVVQGDEVRWSDVAGLEVAKNALRETVVYPFLRPDLFMGLREPARGMLLFGPPGTGKTMLARAVATESRSAFFSISASSLTSKYLGESEKLVRALFALARRLAPSIIFVDEIDSLLSRRGAGAGEHEATRRIKTEFLIQWSDLQRAAAGREPTTTTAAAGGGGGSLGGTAAGGPAGAGAGIGGGGGGGERVGGGGESGSGIGDPNRVLVLAATNLPWAIDEAARRRFVRRQYIPLPEPETRASQLRTLLSQQKHSLTDADIAELVDLTDGFSGSDITALAKDAAMGPLRSLGEALLHMTMDQIRPIELADFRASLRAIRPSVGKEGLKEYEDWARQYGERGG
ncbi:hypothetical protein SLS62_005860 [Diatrype stigma]|uniref:AAA+ ATPase domain-containing protein n=1 Tax=Diatrype stigma TaxID=117547 RepID=A0AAN9YRQ3_9PEZI